MNALVVGSNSDIGHGLKHRLAADGWQWSIISGRMDFTPADRWDLLILCHGNLFPIARFFDIAQDSWNSGLIDNAIAPLRSLRAAWPYRNQNATVVFLGGPNMSKPSPTYTAYRAGKAIIESLVETLGVEYPDTRFRILHPGVVNTKIHQQTIAAGDKAANIERVKRIVSGEEPTVSHDDVYEKLKALL